MLYVFPCPKVNAAKRQKTEHAIKTVLLHHDYCKSSKMQAHPCSRDHSYYRKSNGSRKSNGGVAELKDYDYYPVQRSGRQKGGHKGAGSAVHSGALAHRILKQKNCYK